MNLSLPCWKKLVYWNRTFSWARNYLFWKNFPHNDFADLGHIAVQSKFRIKLWLSKLWSTACPSLPVSGVCSGCWGEGTRVLAEEYWTVGETLRTMVPDGRIFSVLTKKLQRCDFQSSLYCEIGLSWSVFLSVCLVVSFLFLLRKNKGPSNLHIFSFVPRKRKKEL